MSLKPNQLDEKLCDAIADAIKSTHDQIRRRMPSPTMPPVNERVGMFATNLRRSLHGMTNISKELNGYCIALTKPSSWNDIGIPDRNTNSYSSGYFHLLKCRYDMGGGIWEMDINRLKQLAERASMNASWVPPEKQLDQAITLGLSQLDSDLKSLDLKIKDAEMINVQAGVVANDLIAIAERLCEAA